MKKLLAGAACLALLASPALAQSFNPDDGDGNVLTGPGYNPAPLWGPDHDYGYGFGGYGGYGGYVGYGYDYVDSGSIGPGPRMTSTGSESTYPTSGTTSRYQAVEAPARAPTTETEPAYPNFGVPRRY
jgi:opacity protein-like surface antigen